MHHSYVAKFFLILTLFTAFTTHSQVYAQAGSLNLTFGDNGKVVKDVGVNNFTARDHLSRK